VVRENIFFWFPRSRREPVTTLTVSFVELDRRREAFLRWSAHRYTQMPISRKGRHTGMDAGIQARDGNLMVPYMLDLASVPIGRLPSLDAGFRHPCRNDVDFHLGGTFV
jgi:hypothetical protein